MGQSLGEPLHGKDARIVGDDILPEIVPQAPLGSADVDVTPPDPSPFPSGKVLDHGSRLGIVDEDDISLVQEFAIKS